MKLIIYDYGDGQFEVIIQCKTRGEHDQLAEWCVEHQFNARFMKHIFYYHPHPSKYIVPPAQIVRAVYFGPVDRATMLTIKLRLV